MYMFVYIIVSCILPDVCLSEKMPSEKKKLITNM